MQRVIRNSLRLWIWVLFVTIIGFAAQCKSTAAAEKTKGDNMNLIKVAKEIRGEIVQIVVPLQDNNNSVGSGFWVDQRGYIATCWHVVSGNPTATLKVQSAIDPLFDLKSNIIISANWEVFSAKVIAKDEINDLALVKIDGNPFLPRKSIPTIGHKTLNAHYKESALKTELPEPGQKIFLAGYPFRTIISSGTRRDGCLHRSRPS